MSDHVEDADSQANSADGEQESLLDAADWSGDELEQAYLRAIEVLEASERTLPEGIVVHSNSELDPLEPLVHSAEFTSSLRENTGLNLTAGPRVDVAVQLEELALSRMKNPSAAPAAILPRQIVEACLFVGGEPFTAKKLSSVFRGEFSVEYIERELDDLNSLYRAESRPYEIRLGDGGYRLSLQPEYERIRNKAYGLGPKEVRLSQEALEVLAVVAYQQPISAKEIEHLGKPGSGAILRQLLRRELIAVKRRTDGPHDVEYVTTSRFLSLFSIRSLDELPRHDQVGYK